MKTRIIASCVASAIALLSFTGVNAATADKVTRVYNDVVAPADQVAYEAGVKAYNKCLGEHGFKYTWTALGHETGNTYLYSYISGPHSWADFDAMHESGKACDDAWRTNANPHLKGETSTFLVEMPEMSHMSKDMNAKPVLTNITFFTLKHGHDAYVMFTDAVKKINAAAEKSNWGGHYTFQSVRGGDKNFPDFIASNQYKSWADYGADVDPPLWKMVEGAYGKAEADALRKAINDSTEDITSHVDVYNADLTYTAPK